MFVSLRANATALELHKISALCFAFLCLCILPSSAFAQEAANEPEWYEKVGGILAIPVAIFGIPLTWVTIRKTNLEAKKTRLEIQEKERKLSQSRELTGSEEAEILRPILRESILGSVMFRFILLYLILQIWGIVASLWSILLSGTRIGLQRQRWFEDLFIDNPLFEVGFFVLTFMPQIVTWGIILSLGWPLLKDVNRYVRIVGKPDSA